MAAQEGSGYGDDWRHAILLYGWVPNISAQTGIGFRAADWVDIALLYHHLAWDIGGRVIEDLEFSGPALGVVFRF